jgi:hypothetical protein
MNSHEYADRMILLATNIKSRPMFELPRYEDIFSPKLMFFSDSEGFLAALHSLGNPPIDVTNPREAIVKIGNLKISADREVVLEKIQDEKWQLKPGLKGYVSQGEKR